MSSQPPTALYLKVGLGAFALIVVAIVVAMLIVDEIHKAELRDLLRNGQEKIDAAVKRRVDAPVRDRGRQSRIEELTQQVAAAEQEYRDAEAAVNGPIIAASRKEEVEESGRRYDKAKLIEARLIDLRTKLKEATESQ